MGQSRRDPTPEELRRRAAIYRGQAASPSASAWLTDRLTAMADRMDAQAAAYEVCD